MKRRRIFALLALIALGAAVMNGCAGWQANEGSSSNPSSGGHRH
jgi:hypothetical protein